MRNVTVNRDEFLVEVTANREAHREVFEEALEGYHRRLKAETRPAGPRSQGRPAHQPVHRAPRTRGPHRRLRPGHHDGPHVRRGHDHPQRGRVRHVRHGPVALEAGLRRDHPALPALITGRMGRSCAGAPSGRSALTEICSAHDRRLDCR